VKDYSLAELSALSKLSIRTIRYYLAEGLAPSPGKEGPSTRYPAATLARLRLIVKLRNAHQPLAEIRKRLDALSDAEVLSLTATPDEPEPAGSALDYVRSLLGSPDQLTAFDEPAAQSPPLGYSVASVDWAADMTLRSPTPDQTVEAPSVPRTQWERLAITPDIELHVRRPLSRRDNRVVDRLIAFARQLQEEDKP